MHKWFLLINKQQEELKKLQEASLKKQEEMMKLMKELIATRKNNAFDDDGFSVGL